MNAQTIKDKLACGRPSCQCRTPRGNTHCPAHADSNPSLSVSDGDDGGVSRHCFAGCEPDAVTDALRDRGLVPTLKRTNRTTTKRIVATYDYTDEQGALLFQAVRYTPKDFRQRRRDGDGWTWNLEATRRVLYRLPELLAADPSSLVWIVEGEKDADRLAAHGFVATTSPMGAGKWLSEYGEALRDHDVVLVEDNDEAGRAHVATVAVALTPFAKSIRIFTFRDLKPGADISDALDGGIEPDALVTAAAALTPVNEGQDLASTLNDVRGFVGKYVVLTPAQLDAIALWVAHTHALDAADATPYLVIGSAEKRSGKSRLLETLSLLVARPWFTGKTSAAVLVRKTDAEQSTLLLDESDAAFNGERDYAEALRGLLNTGHRRGGCASMCIGQGANLTSRDFNTFSAKAIAGIGKLPDTVADRGIAITMKRRAPGEQVQRFRYKAAEGDAGVIRDALAAWSTTAVTSLTDARPAVLDALDDRAFDGWEPLLAIADLAGADWPERAQAAAVKLSGISREDDSLGVRLLSDIRAVFTSRNIDRLQSVDLAAALAAIEEAPWGAFGKRETKLDARTLARLLHRYEVKPAAIRVPNVVKGYHLDWFKDAFARYLPSDGYTVTSDSKSGDFEANAQRLQTPSEPTLLPTGWAASEHVSDSESGDCNRVTAETPVTGAGHGDGHGRDGDEDYCACGGGVSIYGNNGTPYCTEHASQRFEVMA